jgi:hypothetical protein
MNAQERLRLLIHEKWADLRATVLPNREEAILSLIRTLDQLPHSSEIEPKPNLITGRHFADLGGNKALQLCLESTLTNASMVQPIANGESNVWAGSFLQECAQLAEIEMILAQCKTGFMRLVEDGDRTFDAWIATKRAPASWRERADIDWWASWLYKHNEPELHSVLSERPTGDRSEAIRGTFYRRVADVHLKMMAYQFGYPPEAAISGVTIQTYLDVLCRLIGLALQTWDRGETVTAQSERSLIATIATDLAADPAVIDQAITDFTLDREKATYHAAVPGVAAAPIIRVGPNQLVWSVHGLTTEPLLFLTREIRRRAAQEYHNAAYLREAVFRRDLYALFQDKRFVTSTGRIELRRTDGDVRTDIDAVVFDRKNGTLGLFELKSQDPFARSTGELTRQRDNVLYANRQISGVLDWLKRHGADELLQRVDSRTAKTFRAQKVYPFVLGRYIAHFNDGPMPDRRAAWGAWPQLLRLIDGQPFRATDANPLASLFTRLTKDVPLERPRADDFSREINFGQARVVVHPSYAAFQESMAGDRRSR